MEKYRLTEEIKFVNGHTLSRIEALVDFGDVKRGEKGGWVEFERNLSHDGNAWIYGNAEVGGYAKVLNSSDYIVFKNNFSSFRHFTWTKSNNKWAVGCFYGTGEELIQKAYQDSEVKGKCYKYYVELVENLMNAQDKNSK